MNETLDERLHDRLLELVLDAAGAHTKADRKISKKIAHHQGSFVASGDAALVVVSGWEIDEQIYIITADVGDGADARPLTYINHHTVAMWST